MSVKTMLKTAAVAATLTSASTAAANGPAAYNQHYGNHNFGSGYMVNLGYKRYSPTYARAYGDAGIYGRVFGRQLTVLGAEGVAQSNGGDHSTDLRFTVLGVSMNVGVPGVNSPVALLPEVSRTFFEKEQTFMAGPIPLTVKGEVTGNIGMEGQLHPGADGIGVTVRPYANLTGSASVAVGAACLKAGVRGNLKLVELAFPATVSINAAMEQVTLGADFELSTMAGSIEAFAEACGAEHAWELVNWSGLSENWPLFPQQTWSFGNTTLDQGTYTFTVGGGVHTNRTLFSVPSSGDFADLWSEDENSGRQHWNVFPTGDGQSYYIQVGGGTARGPFLSVNHDGTLVDLYDHDDGSGRQRWVFEDAGNGLSYIRIKGGVTGGRSYLSSFHDGGRVDLWFADDGSGRQRWRMNRLETNNAPVPTNTPVRIVGDTGDGIWAHGAGGFGAHQHLGYCPPQQSHAACQWIFEPSPTRPGAYYIRNANTQNQYLHSHGGVQHGYGHTLHTCEKDRDYPNCQWFVEYSPIRPDARYLRSAGGPLFLHTEHGGTGHPRQTLSGCEKERDYAQCQWSIVK